MASDSICKVLFHVKRKKKRLDTTDTFIPPWWCHHNETKPKKNWRTHTTTWSNQEPGLGCGFVSFVISSARFLKHHPILEEINRVVIICFEERKKEMGNGCQPRSSVCGISLLLSDRLWCCNELLVPARAELNCLLKKYSYSGKNFQVSIASDDGI